MNKKPFIIAERDDVELHISDTGRVWVDVEELVRSRAFLRQLEGVRKLREAKENPDAVIPSPPPRANPIPQSAPEMRDFYYRDPRQKEADFWQDLKLGLLLTLALLGAVAIATYLLLR